MSEPIDVEQYISAPYSRMLIPDAESGTYTAMVLELVGCITQGDTPEQAYARLDEMMGHWIRSELRAGHSIPKPHVLQDYSGELVLRLPPTLHARAAAMAQLEGVSLNHFLIMAVARAVGATVPYLPSTTVAAPPAKKRRAPAPRVAASTRAVRKR